MKRMDLRKSKAVPLILIASVAVFFGFKTCYSHYDGDDDYDRTYYADPSTRPVHRAGGSHYFWSSAHGYSGSGAGSSFHGGTSRGGFGASGHAAGS
jgi:hypothetical protein